MLALIKEKQLLIRNNSQPVQGSVGEQLSMRFSEDWAGLSITAVFSAGGVQRDVAVEGDTLTIPWELYAAEGHALWLNFHGAKANGSVVLRTPRVSLGCIRRSDAPSGNAPEAPTPSRADQIQALAEQALAAAEALQAAAAAGDFDGASGADGADGVSPTVSVTGISGGHRITVTDKNGPQAFDVMDGADGANGTNGTNGTNGADGVSPTVSVTGVSGGHRITVTDKNGSQAFDVMDGADGDAGLFIATYNTTDATEIEAAYQRGKVCLCKYDGRLYALLERVEWGLIPDFTFALTEDSGVRYLYCTESTWSMSVSFFRSGSAPAMDGTASAGAATSFARSDHVHPTDSSRQAQHLSATLTIAAADWSNGSATKTVAGMTATALVFLEFSDKTTEFTVTQAANALSFSAAAAPSGAVTVKVGWFV